MLKQSRRAVTFCLLTVVFAATVLEAAIQNVDVPRKSQLLADKVAKAKSQGKSDLKLKAAIPMYDGVSSLSEALAGYTLIVAEPMISVTEPDPTQTRLWTWRKFRIVQNLSDNELPPANTPIDAAPKQLLPVAENELLIREGGGTLALDGVTVEQPLEFDVDFKPRSKFLLFVSFEATAPGSQVTRLAGIPMGPAGVFLIDGAGKISPVVQSELFDALKVKGILSLTKLGHEVRVRK